MGKKEVFVGCVLVAFLALFLYARNGLWKETKRLSHDLEVLQSKKAGLETDIEAAQSDNDRLRKELAETQKQLDELMSSHQSLQEYLEMVVSDLDSANERIEEVERWAASVTQREFGGEAEPSKRPEIKRMTWVQYQVPVESQTEDRTSEEDLQENLIGVLTLYRSEDHRVEGRVLPISIYQDGEFTQPVMGPESTTDVWSATFDQIPDFSVWGGGLELAKIKVSGATSYSNFDGLVVEGVIPSSTDEDLQNLFLDIPESGWVRYCDHLTPSRTESSVALALSHLPSTNQFFPSATNDECWEANQASLSERSEDSINALIAEHKGPTPLGQPDLMKLRLFDLDDDGQTEMYAKFAWGPYQCQIWSRCMGEEVEVLSIDAFFPLDNYSLCQSASIFAVDVDGDGSREAILENNFGCFRWYEIYQYRNGVFGCTFTSRVFECR